MSDSDFRTRCYIDLKAIQYNYQQIRKLAGPKRQIAAVIKADAYGHGAIEVGQLLSRNANTVLAVATPDEGIRLRKSIPKTPILILSCLRPQEIEAVCLSQCIPSVAHLDTARRLNQLAIKTKKVIPIHVEIDTGMGRIGPYYKEAVDFIDTLSSFSQLSIQGIFTHFSRSDDNPAFTLKQLSRFNQVQQECSANGIQIPIRHTANSAAVINYPQSYYEMLRPGLILYGLYPDDAMKDKIQLKQAMSLSSRIIHLRKAPVQYTVSYGCTFKTRRETLIATVNVGYRNGYDRLGSNQAVALLHGHQVPVIGRICMDQLMLDVTGVVPVKLGDDVVFLGHQGNEFISMSEIALWSKTINYETACTIGSMTQRFYKR